MLPYLLSYVVMAFVLQVSAAILFEATLSLLGLGPSGSASLGIMLYWAIAWGSIRTGAWWAFMPPTIMLTIISFSLLLLQSSLDEVFNPRLRRGKAGKRKGAAPQPDRLAAGRIEPANWGGSGARDSARRLAPPFAAGGRPMTRLLNAEHLTASYRTPDGREVTAVDDVSIYIDEGEVLGVAGESGCGKTTLGSILSLTARPPLYVDSGTLEIDGKVQDLGGNRKVERTWRGSVVSFLPQGAMNAVSPTMRIRDLVYDVVRAHDRSIKKDEALDRARDRLTSLGLPARVIDAYPHQLSGGMKQRTVTIISTLLNPRLLIADEPTSALDVSLAEGALRDAAGDVGEERSCAA